MEDEERQVFLARKDMLVNSLKIEIDGLSSFENVDKEKLIVNFKEKIADFCEKNNVTKEEVIKRVLDSIYEERKVNKRAYEYFNLIEDILYAILYEGIELRDEDEEDELEL